MTQSFDEWFEKNGELYREPTSDERYLFEAGAQSRQAEVDGLQKRIDEAIQKWISITSIATTQRNGLPDEFYQKLDELHDALTLKGNQDEK